MCVWMQQYARYVEAYWANPNLVAKSQTVEAESNVVVAPLLDKIEWGQDYPFNIQCPTYTDAGKTVHYYTGCVATAATQIMRFWKYPKHGTGEKTYTAKGMTLSADFGSTTYDWANMLEAYPKGETSFTPAQTKAVATLAAQFGVAVEMEYEKAGSGAVPMLVPSALKNYFGYDKRTTMLKRSYYSTSEWMDIMRNELDAGRPVYYGGASDAGVAVMLLWQMATTLMVMCTSIGDGMARAMASSSSIVLILTILAKVVAAVVTISTKRWS